MSRALLVERVHGGFAVVTLNRPEARNALNSELLRRLPEVMAELDQDDTVSVIVLTGADPAFCAGLDLRELGSTGANAGPGVPRSDSPAAPWPRITKPVIGAINGPAVTGGLEIALQCDFLIASERARFGDTHARVGALPGWGLSVLLPQAVGIRRAREMSLTGDFMDAEEALRFGLVNRVVPHDDLLPAAAQIAATIAANDQSAVRALLAEYRETSATTLGEALQIEARLARDWNSRALQPAEVEQRRQAIVDRGRTQA
jgi:enoyl-CoA hydratase